MPRWMRVFGRLEAMPDPGALGAFLAGLGAAARFEAGEQGWFRAEMAGLVLERYREDEEGIRAELNSWAAYLETCEGSPHHEALMERAIQSRQLFTLRADEPGAEPLCAALAQELARRTEGFWQADGVGFLDASGAVLVPEE